MKFDEIAGVRFFIPIEFSNPVMNSLCSLEKLIREPLQNETSEADKEEIFPNWVGSECWSHEVGASGCWDDTLDQGVWVVALNLFRSCADEYVE
jgi:hypothetical protein